ncbi:MAG TPA: CPBP family intramembrane glutamic endopeptidase [Anaerolineales bacterium]|nr:CPBP family intramembrane glutamic endopeptidase [Anaerolineales bacterium]HLO31195.1 CPBP family intramembrane glutamic endopeptidase [Anaerolineales bacterium]
MKAFAVRHPLLFAILVSLITILGQWWPFQLPVLPQEAQILLGRTTGLILTVFVLASLNWWQEAGFARIKSWRVLLPYLPIILIVLLAIISNVFVGIRVTDPALILFGAASFLVGGFIEEAIFRGVVLQVFLPRGLLRAALLSAAVFSLVHLGNILLGQDLGATALQLVRAFLVGMAFVAPLAYTRNIWPLVILHALINFTSFLGSGNITLISTESPEIDQVLAEVIVSGLLSGYGIWLLHRAERRNDHSTVIAKQQVAVDRAE